MYDPVELTLKDLIEELYETFTELVIAKDLYECAVSPELKTDVDFLLEKQVSDRQKEFDNLRQAILRETNR